MILCSQIDSVIYEEHTGLIYSHSFMWKPDPYGEAVHCITLWGGFLFSFQYASEDAELLLVGNKLDCEVDREISRQQGEKVGENKSQHSFLWKCEVHRSLTLNIFVISNLFPFVCR